MKQIVISMPKDGVVEVKNFEKQTIRITDVRKLCVHCYFKRVNILEYEGAFISSSRNRAEMEKLKKDISSLLK